MPKKSIPPAPRKKKPPAPHRSIDTLLKKKEQAPPIVKEEREEEWDLPEKPPGIERPRGPPLFIKLDKYQDVVNTLHKMKTFSLSLRDALDALGEVERELQRGIMLANKALDRFNATISELDTKISRMPPEDDFHPEEKAELGEMEDYVKGLHHEVKKIRQSLKTAEH